ncbi:MAG: penicillin-binding protein 2 [Rhodobacteraceae bacterium]|jgi:cell division protein FtsI (penicillin-binding protein 3)|nr:penicillin-binding protein 2 [Paracoccaceae bacterium]
MIRTPLRPLPRILDARENGENPQFIERENLRLRREQARDTGRKRAEWRLVLLAALFFAGYAMIGARMGQLAASPVVEAEPYQGEQIADARADILDRNGRILATNLVTNSLYAELRYMVDGARAAHELALIFPDLDEERLTARLTDPDRRFVWIRARLSPEQAQAVHDIGEPGLLLGPREMRLYPNGSLAAHVLGGAGYGQQGVTAAEIIGTAGVEHRLDDRLRDPDLADVPVSLSLDLGVQGVVEEVLANGIAMLNARAGSTIIMDANTGEIVAMASLPDFDPNDRPAPPLTGDPADHPLFNHAVQGRYELGSVMKAFTVAQVLDLGLATPDTIVDTSGPLRIAGFTIEDFDDYGPRNSVTDVFVHSSNIGTARLAQMIGADRQRAFLNSFGFLEPLSLELAEARGVMPQFPERWGELSTMTISYGHGLAITPVHLAAGYAALVNGGYRVVPTILRRPDTIRGERLVSAQTSETMRALMRAVVVRGTASMAEVDGYAVGGKTGTADKPNPQGGYYEDRVVATFAGAFPMNDPRYVIIVTMDEPSVFAGAETRRTAGWTVVPVSAEIVRRIAPMMGMRPQDPAAIEAALRLR